MLPSGFWSLKSGRWRIGGDVCDVEAVHAVEDPMMLVIWAEIRDVIGWWLVMLAMMGGWLAFWLGFGDVWRDVIAGSISSSA
jgi:hypothetical protein